MNDLCSIPFADSASILAGTSTTSTETTTNSNNNGSNSKNINLPKPKTEELSESERKTVEFLKRLKTSKKKEKPLELEVCH